MRHSYHLGKVAVLLISGGASLINTPVLLGQQPQQPQARVPRPQSTAGARTVPETNSEGELKRTASAVPAPRTQRPAPQSQQPSSADPQLAQMAKALDRILTDWEQHTAKIERLEGQFRLYRYEEVFETETWANGSFWYEKPDKGRMDLLSPNLSKLPTNQAGDPTGNRKSPNGTPYVVKPHVPETWVCTGTVIRQFNHGDGRAERTYSEINIPEQFRGEAIRNSPLPFLFGLKKEEAKRRYQMALGELHNTQQGRARQNVVHIVAYPLEERDAKEWSRAEILLLSDTFLPYSIKTIDPAGTGETVYVFVKSVANNNGLFQKDPFKVSTNGYKKLDSREFDPQPAAPAEGRSQPKARILPRDNNQDG